MKTTKVDKILHSTGYLPPRNEDEMIAFEKIYSKVVVDKHFHINVDSIVNGGCQTSVALKPIGRDRVADDDLRMAARNFEDMPTELVEKLRNQHKKDADKSE